MKVLYLGRDAFPEFRNAVVTIGSFDGLHKAHREIIQQVCSLAIAQKGHSVLITFDPHPKSILDPTSSSIKLLTTLEEKIQLLSSTPLDYLVIVPFSFEFSQMMPEEFVENFLIRQFNPSALVVGFDHRFGLNSTGNIGLLRQFEAEGRFRLVVINKKEEGQVKIGSSLIRQAIRSNNFDLVTQQLGRPYSIQGTVVRGKQVGSQIGYPTANIEISNPEKLIPNKGVYAALVCYNERDYNAMLYIGSRPTLGDHLEQTIEVHIMNFDTYLYGEGLEIKIISFIREDEKFGSVNELLEQIKKDHIRIQQVLHRFHLGYASQKLNPEIAVVILNYNGEQYLREYLPTVFQHHPSNHKLYVIDNASTDESLNYLQYQYPEVRRISLKKNYGFAEGYNKGLAQIDADYFLLLNSDVRVTEDFITPLVRRIQADPMNMAVQPKILSLKEPQKFEYAGAAGGLIDILGYTFAVGRMHEIVEDDEHQYEAPRQIFWSSGAAMLVNAKMFLSIGGFDEDYFAHQEEVDLCWRIQRAGGKIWYEPKARVYHLGGGTLEYHKPGKLFLNFKNNLSTIFKNLPYFYLIFLLPLRFLLDFMISLKYLFSGEFSLSFKVIEAYIISILSTFYLMYKKDHYDTLIEKNRLGPASIQGMLRGSLFFHYYLFGNDRVSKIPAHYLEKNNQ